MATLALTVFGWDLASEPHFMDESAYISQSFYADLLRNQDRDNPYWLTYAGYDLPPLPKYVIGFALKAQGHRRPPPSSMIAWYQNPGRIFATGEALLAARRPSVAFGVLGCLAIYALGTLAKDRRLGGLSALLLMVNPLYALHARRAMSDVYAESLILATAAVGLWGWKRLLNGRSLVTPFVVIALGSGILGGLATLSKLNGALGGLILGVWAFLALALPGFPGRLKAAVVLATLVAGLVSFGTFAAGNPFLYSQPKGIANPALEGIAQLDFWGRARVIADHRVGVSERAKTDFPADALRTMGEKVKVVVVQGFGRFGPLGPRGRTDSTIRFDLAQDRSGFLWLPVVVLGGVAALIRGSIQLKRRQPPTAWAIVGQALVATLVVTAFIPLAWDRYFLSIQPGFALLGGFGIVEGFDLARGFGARKRLVGEMA